MLIFIERRKYATRKGNYITTFHPYYKIWTVENPNGLNPQFKTLREANDWVREQFGLKKLENPNDDLAKDKELIRKKKEAKRKYNKKRK